MEIDTDLTLDQYQDKAHETSIYPRLFTEEQVEDIVWAFVNSYDPEEDNLSALIESIMDRIETPFNRLVYPALGLAGEVGELANKLKKIGRDKGGTTTVENLEDLSEELGDQLWYGAEFATGLNINLAEVAEVNLVKLKSRAIRGVIGGSGDKR